MAVNFEKIVAESGESETEAATAFWVERSPEVAFNIKRSRIWTFVGLGLFPLIAGIAFFFTGPYPDLRLFYRLAPWLVVLGVANVIYGIWLLPKAYRWHVRGESRRFRKRNQTVSHSGRYSVALGHEVMTIEGPNGTSSIPFEKLSAAHTTDTHVHFFTDAGMALTLGRNTVLEGNLDRFLAQYADLHRVAKESTP